MPHATTQFCKPIRTVAAINRYALLLAGTHTEAQSSLVALSITAARWAGRHDWPRVNADSTPFNLRTHVQPPEATTHACRFRLPFGRWRVGRSADCDLHFDCPGISRHHAEIEVLPTRGVIVRDLGSTNGTRLDGELIVEAAVEGSAVLDIGSLHLLLMPDCR